MHSVSKSALAIAICAAGFVSAANAQDTGAATAQAAPQPADSSAVGLEEIIVTAEKRSTNLQRTPISLTALSSETLQEQQVRTLLDIASLVPGFQMGETGGYAQITVRGIGISNFTPLGESAVALNINEVYVSRPVAQLVGLYDIGSIEVLRGPQGTLYGRNATAGSVNITTARPTNELSGYGRVSYGNYDNKRIEGAIGGALVDDQLLIRVAGFVEKRDGYGRNLVTGRDVDDRDAHGFRATLVFSPTPDLKATIIADYFHQRDNGGSYHYFGAGGLTGLPGALGIPPLFQLLGGYTASDPYDIANGMDPNFRLRTASATGMIEWSQGPFSIKSITGYRDQSSFITSPLDGGSTLNGVVFGGEPARQFSQELQAHYDTDHLHLTAGGYLFKETASFSPAVVIFSNTSLNLAFPTLPQRPGDGFVHFAEIGGKQRTNAKAVFGQASVDVAEGVSVIAGIRYSSERKSLFYQHAIDLYRPFTGIGAPPAGVAIPSRTFRSTTPKFGVQYQITPKTLLYATYSKGFKSGGFDAGTDPSTVALGFEPEKLTSYEGGVKTTFLDNRLRFNLSGFYYDYSNLQVPQIVGLSIATSNAGGARLYGGEVEVNAVVTPAFSINANAAWLNTKYTDYVGPDASQPLLTAPIDYRGNRLNNAPTLKAHLDAAYVWEIGSDDLTFKVEGDYSSKIYFSPINFELMGQKSFAKGNAFITYASSQGWYATAYIKNFTNEVVRTSMIVNTPITGTPVQGSYAPPRTYGLELGYKF